MKIMHTQIYYYDEVWVGLMVQLPGMRYIPGSAVKHVSQSCGITMHGWMSWCHA
jgi:hypothetical protein